MCTFAPTYYIPLTVSPDTDLADWVAAMSPLQTCLALRTFAIVIPFHFLHDEHAVSTRSRFFTAIPEFIPAACLHLHVYIDEGCSSASNLYARVVQKTDWTTFTTALARTSAVRELQLYLVATEYELLPEWSTTMSVHINRGTEHFIHDGTFVLAL